ncbi:hypothetical protein BSKO_02865 [Bryopsis sp. KO-2023]|nr:hypothetical protein BSKO_02865 [Bryopsis sp. KO-2023]
MYDSRRLEWCLPINVIVSTLAKLQGKTIAKCSLVSSTWLSACRDPEIRRKLRIDRNWYTLGSTDCLEVDLEPSQSFAIIIDKERVAVGGTIWLKVWDLVEGEWRKLYQDLPRSVKPSLAFTEGGWMIRGSHSGFINGWKDDVSFNFNEHQGRLSAIVGVGRSMIASGGDSTGHIELWKLPIECIGESTTLSREAILEGHMTPVCCLTATEDDRYLISGALDNTIRVWNVHTKTCEKELTHPVWLGKDCLHLSVHDDMLATCCLGNYVLKVRLWRFQAPGSYCGKTFQAYMRGNAIRALWFHENRVVVGDREGYICVFDVESGECIKSLFLSPRRGYSLGVISIWCSTEKLVVAGRGKIRIWNLDT